MSNNTKINGRELKDCTTDVLVKHHSQLVADKKRQKKAADKSETDKQLKVVEAELNKRDDVADAPKGSKPAPVKKSTTKKVVDKVKQAVSKKKAA